VQREEHDGDLVSREVDRSHWIVTSKRRHAAGALVVYSLLKLSHNIVVMCAVRSVLALVLFVIIMIPAGARESASSDPYFDARQHTGEYNGPGRETLSPLNVAEILIAYFGPAEDRHPEWGDAWRGAQLAINDANAEGGYRGKPFRLIAAWSENPWGTGVSRLTRMIYVDGVWAIVGGVNGETTHLAEQIAVKARLPLVSPGNTDLSVNMTNVPWTFTCLPTDDIQAETLGEAMLAEIGDKEYASIATTDHDSRATLHEFRSYLAHRGRRPTLHIDSFPGAQAAEGVAMRIVAAHPRAVLLTATSRDSARLAKALRAAGFKGTIYGGAPLARRVFAVEAGEAAEGTVAPLLFEPVPAWNEFSARFERRFGVKADFMAGQTYDAVRLTIAAIRDAGLNRSLILDAIRKRSPWQGVTGAHDWDPMGRNRRRVRLGRVRAKRRIVIGLGEDEPG
jgi:branched-chain amino acid transport system substrate-binding protein